MWIRHTSFQVKLTPIQQRAYSPRRLGVIVRQPSYETNHSNRMDINRSTLKRGNLVIDTSVKWNQSRFNGWPTLACKGFHGATINGYSNRMQSTDLIMKRGYGAERGGAGRRLTIASSRRSSSGSIPFPRSTSSFSTIPFLIKMSCQR